MSSVISKWIVPGIVTVVVGTIVTIMFSQANIETDLQQRTMSAVDAVANSSSADWAEVKFNARDGQISGMTTDPELAQNIEAQVSKLHGVRTFDTSNITLAPTASPYPFSAVLSEGGKIALSGGVPSFAARDALLEQTGASDAGLELLSGAPDNWLDITGYAVSQLDGLETGEAKLSDSALSVSGQAKSPESYGTRVSTLMGDLPYDLSVENTDIQPAVVEDYTFGAVKGANGIELSGYVPDEATRAKVGELSGVSTDGLMIAAGAPEGFASSLEYGFGYLSHMSEGELDINKSELSVSGQAASAQDYVMANAMGAPEGVAVARAELAPSVEENYFWSAQKRADGSVTVRGFVPDEATRAAIMNRVGPEGVDHMQIAKGAPATFYEDALVGVSALKELETGRAGFSGDKWYLSGQPDTIEDAGAAKTALLTARTDSDKWRVNLAPAHPVVPYTWSAEKFGNGKIVLSGLVPDEGTRAALMTRAGDTAEDQMRIANGAPATFYEDALVGISALKELETGRTGHLASGWFLSGVPTTQEASDAARAGLNTARTDAEKWHVSLVDVPPVPVVPYSWNVQKNEDGSLVVSGNVPDEATRQAIMTRAGEGAVDKMVVSFGAPAHFYEDALVSVSAVKELEQGRSGHGGNGWYIFGKPADQAASDSAKTSLLTARTDASKWYVALDVIAPEPAPRIESLEFEAVLDPETGIAFDGEIPNNRIKTYLGLIAGNASTENLSKSAQAAPEDFSLNARTGVRALQGLNEGRLAYENQQWSLTGKAQDAQTRADVLAQIAALPNGSDWKTRITLPTWVDICQAQINDYTRENSIQFESGSAQIVDDSMVVLEGLVIYLNQCRGAKIEIQGHTDSQGDSASNQVLSEQRAQSVVEALGDMGIGSERLTAIGYGETRPIASNDTAEGRQANRRMVFVIKE